MNTKKGGKLKLFETRFLKECHGGKKRKEKKENRGEKEKKRKMKGESIAVRKFLFHFPDFCLICDHSLYTSSLV